MVATDEKPAKAPRASKAAKQKNGSTTMSPEHKAALAQGREESRIVREYLEALETNKPKRGRKVTTESLQARLDAINANYDEAGPVERLQFAQDRMDIEERLSATENVVDIKELEQKFVKVAKGYADRKGISKAAFRALDVPAALLKEAGIG